MGIESFLLPPPPPLLVFQFILLIATQAYLPTAPHILFIYLCAHSSMGLLLFSNHSWSLLEVWLHYFIYLLANKSHGNFHRLG